MFDGLIAMESYYETEVSRFIALNPCPQPNRLDLSSIDHVPISIIFTSEDPFCSLQDSEQIVLQLTNTEKSFSKVVKDDQSLNSDTLEDLFL